jgi:raffinose/stachyose/melibiose transport system substrate-binding protein
MKWLLFSLIFILVLTACGGNNAETSKSGASPKDGNSPANSSAADEIVTLKFFTALADRSNGPGKIEQDLIDSYMAANSNIKIEVEALQDEPYKAKVKVYSSTNEMPDIIQSWGQASFIDPLIDNDLLMGLDPSDFESSEFVAGSLDGFSKNGKLYGLSRGADFFVLYYNNKILNDHGLVPPTTTSELMNAIEVLRANNVNPIAINGMDGWSLPIWFEYVAQRANGDFNLMDEALAGRASFTDPEFAKSAQDMLDFIKAKGFADGYLTADYGAARNMFGQEQAAMFLMGNWEAGLATDDNFSEDFRNNVSAVSYPASDQGALTDVAAWFGGGYSISNQSKHKEEAVAFMQYFFKPENWARQLWESGAGTPAQKFGQFLTGKETKLQKQLVEIFNNMTSSSGTPVLDMATDEFKQEVMDLHQQLLAEQITPSQFAERMDAAAAKIDQ